MDWMLMAVDAVNLHPLHRAQGIPIFGDLEVPSIRTSEADHRAQEPCEELEVYRQLILV